MVCYSLWKKLAGNNQHFISSSFLCTMTPYYYTGDVYIGGVKVHWTWVQQQKLGAVRNNNKNVKMQMCMGSTAKSNISFLPIFFKICKGWLLPSNVAVKTNGSPESFRHVIVVLCIKIIGHVLKNLSPYFSLDAWPSQFFLGFLGLENVPGYFSPYTRPRFWCHTGRLPWWLGHKGRWIASRPCELFHHLHSAMIQLLIESEGIRNLLLNLGFPGR